MRITLKKIKNRNCGSNISWQTLFFNKKEYSQLSQWVRFKQISQLGIEHF